jgi:heparosan-N-sulfate-glucuronate 5-epimerase
MEIARRAQYYRRILQAYLLPGKSQLTFWHERPQMSEAVGSERLGAYFMPFHEKANYAGLHDALGIPLLDYRGSLGAQYNPIAIAQWGLGNYNQFRNSGDLAYKNKFLAASDWLLESQEQNSFGVWVWQHHFDWEYRTRLKSPWHSGLAQGQGISLLVRAHAETGNSAYLEAAKRAFESFKNPTSEGGVTFTDSHGDLWFEEYIVDPPTHILNGFIWAAWGVFDYYKATGDRAAGELFQRATRTLLRNLHRYDLGFWSLYELSGNRIPMVASRFYHALHIVQLRVMYALTNEASFRKMADRWESYGRSRTKRTRALCYKSAFKLCYY